MADKLDKSDLELAAYTALTLGGTLMYCVNEGFRQKTNAKIRGGLKKFLQEATSGTVPKPEPAIDQGRVRVSAQSGIVYLLQAGPFYKIGKAVNFDRRLKQIRLQLPYPVTVIHTMQASDMNRVETYWQKRFALRRANGEWFILNEAEVAEFRAKRQM